MEYVGWNVDEIAGSHDAAYGIPFGVFHHLVTGASQDVQDLFHTRVIMPGVALSRFQRYHTGGDALRRRHARFTHKADGAPGEDLRLHVARTDEALTLCCHQLLLILPHELFSCQVGLKKPDPRIYRLACDQLGVPPERCLYIGDGSSRELSGAAAVGMHPVMLRAVHEDLRDAHHIDAEEWQGLVIATPVEVPARVGMVG